MCHIWELKVKVQGHGRTKYDENKHLYGSLENVDHIGQIFTKPTATLHYRTKINASNYRIERPQEIKYAGTWKRHFWGRGLQYSKSSVNFRISSSVYVLLSCTRFNPSLVRQWLTSLCNLNCRYRGRASFR